MIDRENRFSKDPTFAVSFGRSITFSGSFFLCYSRCSLRFLSFLFRFLLSFTVFITFLSLSCFLVLFTIFAFFFCFVLFFYFVIHDIYHVPVSFLVHDIHHALVSFLVIHAINHILLSFLFRSLVLLELAVIIISANYRIIIAGIKYRPHSMCVSPCEQLRRNIYYT